MKAGVDDFLMANGIEAFREQLEAAWNFDPSWNDTQAEIAWQTRDLTPRYSPRRNLSSPAGAQSSIGKGGEFGGGDDS